MPINIVINSFFYYIIFDPFSEAIKKFDYKPFIHEIPFKYHCGASIFQINWKHFPINTYGTILGYRVDNPPIYPLGKGTTLFVLKSGYPDEYRVRIVINLSKRWRRYNSRYRCLDINSIRRHDKMSIRLPRQIFLIGNRHFVFRSITSRNSKLI